MKGNVISIDLDKLEIASRNKWFEKLGVIKSVEVVKAGMYIIEQPSPEEQLANLVKAWDDLECKMITPQTKRQSQDILDAMGELLNKNYRILTPPVLKQYDWRNR